MQTGNEKIKERTRLTYLILFWSLSAFCIVLEVLCVKQTTIAAVAIRQGFWVYLLTSATVLLFLLSAFLIFADYPVMVKLLLSGNIFTAIALTVLFFLQKTEFFAIIQNAESLRQFIQKSGIWTPLFYITFQFLQVIVLPVPGIVSTLAGIALFGAFKTAVYSFIGIWLGSVLAFYVGRKLGKKAVVWLIGDETLKKWQDKLKGKDNFVLTIMFLLPLFPDDILCFIAGLSKMSWKYFLIMISACRLLAVFATCYSINFIPVNSPWGIAVWGITLTVIIAAFVLIYKNLNTLDMRFKNWRAKYFHKKH